MSRNKFNYGLGLCFIFVLFLSTSAFAQSQPTQPTPNKGQVESTADGMQQFVVKWFPLVFVIGIVAVCVLLYWISTGITTLCERVSGLPYTLHREMGNSSDAATKVETALATVSQRVGAVSDVAGALEKVQTSLASLGDRIDRPDLVAEVILLTGEVRQLTQAVREQYPRKG